MKPDRRIAFVTSLLLAVSLLLVVPASRCKILLVPEEYPRIQMAIDAADPGDVIRVAAGRYSENLRITKRIKLIGQGPANTIIVGDGTVVSVNADDVEIRGFTIGNGTYGIFLWHSHCALLRDNVMSGNRWNFGVWGDSLSHFIHNVDSSNIVDGKPIYFWVNRDGESVPKDAGYVALVNSTNIRVEDSRLTSNEQGVLLVDAEGCLIKNVTMLGNDEGIALRTSHNNTVTRNNLIRINWHAIYLQSSHINTLTENTIRNGTYGILAQNSSGNLIYHNNFIDNGEPQYQLHSLNKWDNGAEGNYWSDYTGEDTDGDDIGDTLLPHLEVDRYPLMKLFDNILPMADAGENRTAFRNNLILFNASSSSDNLGIDSYIWNFGDGSNDTGVTTSHRYAATGEYTVTLTVTDGSGNTAKDSTVITVVDVPPVFPWWILPVLSGTAAIILFASFSLRKYGKRKRREDKAKPSSLRRSRSVDEPTMCQR